RRRHTRWPRDWSSDVCSSDLIEHEGANDYLRQERKWDERARPELRRDRAEGQHDCDREIEQIVDGRALAAGGDDDRDRAREIREIGRASGRERAADSVFASEA